MTLPTVDSSLTPGPDFERDPSGWLVTQARTHGLRFLLAHADDGVIWGRVDGTVLVTSNGCAPTPPGLRLDSAPPGAASASGVASPPTREVLQTLQQCRLFSEKGELWLWRSDQGWGARLLLETPDAEASALDDLELLWGTSGQPYPDDFTLLSEGRQGLRHAVPYTLIFPYGQRPPIRLRVRHYVDYDETTGEARIALSRLVNLEPA